MKLQIAVAPGGPAWLRLGGTAPTGFAFSDVGAAQDGLQKLRLKGGNPGRDKLQAKAGGAALPVPPAASASQLLAQQDDVTVQLVNDAGGCWQSVFPPAAVQQNAVDRYKAKR
ncbi:MAG: hypothetical protein U0802_07600 [Candidatus Binatia bacterium]